MRKRSGRGWRARRPIPDAHRTLNCHRRARPGDRVSGGMAAPRESGWPEQVPPSRRIDRAQLIQQENFMDIDTGLETKAGIPHDAVVTHAEMVRAFEAFKETNDERLSRRDSDVVLEEKLARINSAIDGQARRLDDLSLKS